MDIAMKLTLAIIFSLTLVLASDTHPLAWSGNKPSNHCPLPTEYTLKCLNEWVCQNVINLDLRCLLNLNGNPLIKNLLNSLNGNGHGIDDNGLSLPIIGGLLGR